MISVHQAETATVFIQCLWPELRTPFVRQMLPSYSCKCAEKGKVRVLTHSGTRLLLSTTLCELQVSLASLKPFSKAVFYVSKHYNLIHPLVSNDIVNSSFPVPWKEKAMRPQTWRFEGETPPQSLTAQRLKAKFLFVFKLIYFLLVIFFIYISNVI